MYINYENKKTQILSILFFKDRPIHRWWGNSAGWNWDWRQPRNLIFIIILACQEATATWLPPSLTGMKLTRFCIQNEKNIYKHINNDNKFNAIILYKDFNIISYTHSRYYQFLIKSSEWFYFKFYNPKYGFTSHIQFNQFYLNIFKLHKMSIHTQYFFRIYQYTICLRVLHSQLNALVNVCNKLYV